MLNFVDVILNQNIMGALKLSIIESEEKRLKERIRIIKNGKNIYHISACDCPCWAFIHKGEKNICNDIASTASWNID